MRFPRRAASFILGAVVSVIGPAAGAFGQVAEHRVSIGGSVSGMGMLDETGAAIASPGIGAWFSVNLMGPLALDAQLDWFPRREASYFESQGGRALKLTFGARGTLLESRRLRLQGIMRGGIVRFSETMTGHADGTVTLGPGTHGAMDIGFGVEFLPHSRVRPRVDYVMTLYVVPGSVLGTSGPGPVSLVAVTPAKIEDTSQLSVGIMYGFGAPRSSAASTPPARRWTVGPLVTGALSANLLDLGINHRAGIGGFVSYRLSRIVHADGVLSTFPQATRAHTPWDGGRVLQALGGLKVGIQGERIGLFVKARVGIDSHGDALMGRQSSPYAVTLGRSNLPVLDMGGIVEVATGTRFLMRIEAGDAMTFYPDRTIVLDGVQVPQGSQPPEHQIQACAGVGWRF